MCFFFLGGGGGEGSKGERERKLINLCLKFTSRFGACLISRPASVFFSLRWMMIPLKINTGSLILFSRTNRMKQNYVINVSSRSLKTIPSEFFSPFKTNSILLTQRKTSGEILEVKCTF